MLQVLKQIDTDIARRALADASLQFLSFPRAEFMGSSAKAAAPDLVGRIVDEVIATSTKINTGAEAQWAAAVDLLSKSLTEIMLTEANKDSVRGRLGASGKLPVGLYQIQFTPGFLSNVGFYLVSRKHAESAVLNSDKVEHLSAAATLANVAEPHTSLFVQRTPSKVANYRILVKCNRIGGVLVLDHAFRIYDDVVSGGDELSPLELLRQFCEQTGEIVRVVHRHQGAESHVWESKFLSEITIEAAAGDVIEIHLGKTKVQEIGLDGKRTVQVDVTYSIRHDLYRAQMIKHGEKPGVPQPSFTSGLAMRGVKAAPTVSS